MSQARKLPSCQPYEPPTRDCGSPVDPIPDGSADCQQFQKVYMSDDRTCLKTMWRVLLECKQRQPDQDVATLYEIFKRCFLEQGASCVSDNIYAMKELYMNLFWGPDFPIFARGFLESQPIKGVAADFQKAVNAAIQQRMLQHQREAVYLKEKSEHNSTRKRRRTYR